jgi:hypothetical protein
MKKQVIRLTEGDLNYLIKSTVNRILKEDIFNNNNMSMEASEIDNISYIEINDIEDGRATFNASGEDNSEYQIYVTYYVNKGMGEIPSSDYDVPSDFDSDSISIESVAITKWNDMNEEEDIPYSKNIGFEQELADQIEEYLHSHGEINNPF